MEKVAKTAKVNGAFTFVTCVTAKGRPRAILKIVGDVPVVDEKGVETLQRATVQCFMDWEGKLPSFLKALRGHIPADAQTGLRRTLAGDFVGSVEVPEGATVDTRISEMNPDYVFRTVEVSDPTGFAVEKTEMEYVDCD